MLKKFLNIVKQKHEIDKKQDWYQGSQTYFQGLQDEIEEVRVEMKENNTVYLEDELGDILRNYLNLLEGLTDEGKITSPEAVLQRAEKKYTERVDAIIDAPLKSGAWKKIKDQQKTELKKEHEEKYGKIEER